MRKKQVEEICDSVIEWCVKNHGCSKFYDGLPIVEIEFEEPRGIRAEYDSMNNLMTIYVRGNRSVKQLVKSVLHEYRHYLQSPTWLERYSTMYRRKQDKNPYEIDAEIFADSNWKVCMLELNLQ